MMWQSSSGFGTTHPEDPSGRNPHQNSPHISRLQVLRPAPGPLPVSLANAVKPLLGEAATFRRLSADTLFFCFYFQQASTATKSFTMNFHNICCSTAVFGQPASVPPACSSPCNPMCQRPADGQANSCLGAVDRDRLIRTTG